MHCVERQNKLETIKRFVYYESMMREFNRLFAELVDEYDKLNQCVDHHGLQDRFLLLLVHHADAHIYVFSVELSVHGHIHLLC